MKKQLTHRFVERGDARGLAGPLGAGCVLAALAGCQTQTAEVYRGRQLRTETVREVPAPYLRPMPWGATGGDIQFQIEHWARVRIYERPVYEAVNRYANPNDLNRDHIRHEPIPNKELFGDIEERVQKRRSGVLANAAVQCLGAPTETDERGILSIDAERVLKHFDDPTRKTLSVDFIHPKYGRFETELTREALLALYGIQSQPDKSRDSHTEGVKFSVAHTKMARQGETVTFEVKATNEGAKPAFGVRARLFSRRPWLNGRFFYIGDLDPGQSQSFKRTLEVPTDAEPGDGYAQIGVRHAGGPIERVTNERVTNERVTLEAALKVSTAPSEQ